MRSKTRFRNAKVALATLVLLAIATNPPVLNSGESSRPAPPSPEELQVLEELLDWVRGGPDARRFRALEGISLTSAVRDRPRSFDLFRSMSLPQERLTVLNEIPYGDLIRGAAERFRVDGLLLAAVIEAESGFDPAAISPDGALGLMQIMPETAAFLGAGDVADPATNVHFGARYLSSLLREYDGDVTLALAAYNAGPGNVERYAGMPPFGETRRYVEKVLRSYVRHHRRLWQSRSEGDWLIGSAAS